VDTREEVVIIIVVVDVVLVVQKTLRNKRERWGLGERLGEDAMMMMMTMMVMMRMIRIIMMMIIVIASRSVEGILFGQSTHVEIVERLRDRRISP